ncbi:MAG TPA: hypothetical protein VIX86_09115 [Streptosporangiaceae bacterium]
MYLTADELLELERARLTLRARGIVVDRGRLVREAIAILLVDLESGVDASVIARRLRAAASPVNGAGQGHSISPLNGGSQVNGNGQANDASPLNGASQFNGASQVNGSGQLNGASHVHGNGLPGGLPAESQ